jgi:hypothetical protein
MDLAMRKPWGHPGMSGPRADETYIAFRNFRNTLMARTALYVRSQVNTDKNRCLR